MRSNSEQKKEDKFRVRYKMHTCSHSYEYITENDGPHAKLQDLNPSDAVRVRCRICVWYFHYLLCTTSCRGYGIIQKNRSSFLQWRERMSVCEYCELSMDVLVSWLFGAQHNLCSKFSGLYHNHTESVNELYVKVSIFVSVPGKIECGSEDALPFSSPFYPIFMIVY